MQIITNFEKLKNLTDEETALLKANAKNGTLMVLVDNNTDSVPISLLPTIMVYGDRLTFNDKVTLDLTSPFNIGVILGFLSAVDSSVKVMLPKYTVDGKKIADKIKDEFNILQTTSSPTSKKKVTAEPIKRTRKPRKEKEVEEDEELGEVAKKLEKEKKEAKVDNSLPFPEVKKNYDLISVFKGTANLEIANIMNSKSRTNMLVEGVKKATDKKIGLPIILQTYFGKETAENIIDEVREKYDIIQAM